MGAMKWLVIFVLLGVCSQAASAAHDITVTVFASTSKTVLVRWTRFPGATSYKLTAALQSSPNDPVAFATFGPNTVLGSISLSQTGIHVFKVEALGATEETLSNSTVESPTAPEAMDPFQEVNVEDSTSLSVKFNLKTGATNYIIRVQNADGFYREDMVSSSPAEIKSLTPYTEYTLSILAANAVGFGQPSPSVTVKTALPAITQLYASSPSNDSITVSWEPVANAVQYVITIENVASSESMKHNSSDTNLTISGLDAGSQYLIQGRAWDIEGREGQSGHFLTQITRPATPSSVNISMVMDNGVAALSVSWDKGQGNYSGSVQYNVVSDQNLTCNSTLTSCRLSPVGCGEVHTVQVTVSNHAGPSFPSSHVFISYPCPPQSLAIAQSTEANCTLSWDPVPHADSYVAFIKRADGSEATCNTTDRSNCTFNWECGRTYLMSVSAFNLAGSSPKGKILNHTTVPCCPQSVSVSTVSSDTLGITWAASRGALLYETRAADSSEVILCNDTAPMCTLSDLSCDRSYSVRVIPCNEISGCNLACTAHTKDTAPCTPMHLELSQKNSSCVSVSWTANNRDATYTVSATGEQGTPSCTTNGSSCDITDLPCGSAYEVSVTATSTAGQSLPSFSDTLETAPCCPVNIEVDQITMATTNVSWSHAKGADTFITSLTSSRGHARCHTRGHSCLMGCITCGTNYTVTMEAFSRTGHSSNCTYQGFSSSACCPSGVRLYQSAGNSVLVHWRGSGGDHHYITEMSGSSNNYTCTAPPGESSCNLTNIQCGEDYRVVVAPLTPEGSQVPFCPQRQYKVTCSGAGSNIGTVMYRGRRSVD